jgi:taurine dioxygenase
VGATISGVDLRERLDAGTVAEVRRALLDHGVIFFREQALTSEQMHAFVSQFGAPISIDYFGGANDEARRIAPGEIVTGDLAPTRQGTAVWHADVTWLAKPPFATALRAAKLPRVGGDTCWADMEAAYEALSEPFRRMLDGLTAVHSMQPTVDREDLLKRALLAKGRPDVMENVHPVVSVHPETGRKALFVNECSTTRILELSPIESLQVLSALFMHIRTPDFMVRWRWSTNDVAFWDNRSVQHYAVPDYDEQRVMQRVELAGERPVGP